jgi:hypothetical protein
MHATNSKGNSIKDLCFPKSYNIKRYENKKYNTFTVSYQAKLPYPSKAVIEYYDLELKRIGWFPYAESYYKKDYRKWDCFEDGTRKGSPLVHQLIAKWANKSKTRMITLGIRYYSYDRKRKDVCCDEGPSNDIQYINMQIMPFVALPN